MGITAGQTLVYLPNAIAILFVINKFVNIKTNRIDFLPGVNMIYPENPSASLSVNCLGPNNLSIVRQPRIRKKNINCSVSNGESK